MLSVTDAWSTAELRQWCNVLAADAEEIEAEVLQHRARLRGEAAPGDGLAHLPSASEEGFNLLCRANERIARLERDIMRAESITTDLLAVELEVVIVLRNLGLVTGDVPPSSSEIATILKGMR